MTYPQLPTPPGGFLGGRRGAPRGRAVALAAILALAPLVPSVGSAAAAERVADRPASAPAQPPVATPGAPEPTGPLWYRIDIDGAPAGWAWDRIERTGGRVTTSSRMELRLRRGGADVAITLSSRFVETAGGEPVLLHQRQILGQLPVESTFRFVSASGSGPRSGPHATPGRDRVEATTVQAGRETRETVPAPAGEWLTPDAARRAFLAHRRAGETRFTVRSIEPLQGLEPTTLSWRRLGPGTVSGAVDRWRQVEAAGGSIGGGDGARPAEGPAAPGTASGSAATVEIDADGRLVWSSTRFLGLELTLTRTDRESALASADGSAAPELMVSTFVHPNRPIPAPRRLRHAVYELSLAPASGAADDAEPPTLPPLPSTGAQRVTAEGDRVRIEIEVLAPDSRTDSRAGSPAASRPTPPDADAAVGAAADETARYLAPSPFLDSRDPAIRQLLASLDGPARPRPPDADRLPATGSGNASGDTSGGDSARPEEAPRRRAARLTALVRSRISNKNLDTGFATASEVARTLSGDCTEHAVLLAALLRADGIPSRVASGLVYLERFAGERDVFGYHMWTQALLDGRWVDLDAALPGEVDGFDATHVALAVSALDGPEAAADFVPLAGLIGRLRIDVEQLRY